MFSFLFINNFSNAMYRLSYHSYVNTEPMKNEEIFEKNLGNILCMEYTKFLRFKGVNVNLIKVLSKQPNKNFVKLINLF